MDAPIYHRGMAEALGVSHKKLEGMTIRKIVNRAFKRGLDLELTRGGVGPGLTLSATTEEKKEV